jgi:hypothetical protein
MELISNESCFLISLDVYSVFLNFSLLILYEISFEFNKKSDTSCLLLVFVIFTELHILTIIVFNVKYLENKVTINEQITTKAFCHSMVT